MVLDRLAGALTGAGTGFLSTGGNPIGAAVGGLTGLIGGGGGSSSSDDAPSANPFSGPSPFGGQDFFSLYGQAAALANVGAQAAAANAPLTMATTRFAGQSGANIGAMASFIEGLSSGQKSILADALRDSQAARGLQTQEVAGMLDKGQNLAYQTGQAKLALEQLPPAFGYQAGMKQLDTENQMTRDILGTNLAVKSAQEGAKLNIAQNYANNLGNLLETRGATEGRLAEGAQKIAGALALNDAQIIGDLTGVQARTKGDLARIRANTAATKDLRRNAMGIAMTGQNYFA
jgi:hypothetical protein